MSFQENTNTDIIIYFPPRAQVGKLYDFVKRLSKEHPQECRGRTLTSEWDQNYALSCEAQKLLNSIITETKTSPTT